MKGKYLFTELFDGFSEAEGESVESIVVDRASGINETGVEWTSWFGNGGKGMKSCRMKCCTAVWLQSTPF